MQVLVQPLYMYTAAAVLVLPLKTIYHLNLFVVLEPHPMFSATNDSYALVCLFSLHKAQPDPLIACGSVFR